MKKRQRPPQKRRPQSIPQSSAAPYLPRNQRRAIKDGRKGTIIGRLG